MDLKATTLRSNTTALEPIHASHRVGLKAAAENGIDWTYMPIVAIGDRFDQWFDWSCQVHQSGENIVFVARNVEDQRIVGSTRFLNIDKHNKRCEIGFTWYEKPAQGTHINPGAKYLLFDNAFNSGAIRVELKCDALNMRSRAAILKLGATFEGILRHHMIMPGGRLRDTAYYSVLKDEWPSVRDRLTERLA